MRIWGGCPPPPIQGVRISGGPLPPHQLSVEPLARRLALNTKAQVLAAVRFQKLLECRPLPGWPSAAAPGAPRTPCAGYHGDSGQERRLPPGDQALLSRGPGCAPGPCHRAVAARPPRGDPAARFRPSRRDRTERGGLSLTQPRFPRRTRPAEPGARGGGDVRLQGLRVHFRAALAVPSWPDGGRTARAPRHLSRGESSDPAGSRLLNYTCQKLPTAPRAGCVVWGRTTPARGLGACWGQQRLVQRGHLTLPFRGPPNFPKRGNRDVQTRAPRSPRGTDREAVGQRSPPGGPGTPPPRHRGLHVGACPAPAAGDCFAAPDESGK